jgi:hypothetical protein
MTNDCRGIRMRLFIIGIMLLLPWSARCELYAVWPTRNEPCQVAWPDGPHDFREFYKTTNLPPKEQEKQAELAKGKFIVANEGGDVQWIVTDSYDACKARADSMRD